MVNTAAETFQNLPGLEIRGKTRLSLVQRFSMSSDFRAAISQAAARGGADALVRPAARSAAVPLRSSDSHLLAPLRIRRGHRQPTARREYNRPVFFKVIGRILDIETIATGKGIREWRRLRKLYGGRRWRKLKGNGDSQVGRSYDVSCRSALVRGARRWHKRA
jgi:hypothetical protein